MKKPHITRTYSQIHFEDLDPKRFEDLIRELIYDYRDWQNIEATGRSGNDKGFDIRAFEKNISISVSENKEGDEVETVRTSEGNQWMIQGKREKVIGPTRIKEILKDVEEKNPPYGYILAASSNFSKLSYDVFRTELQKKGVMEFHLWGKPELEDMLHQPKNDRILFTFFGISLASKRRSRATEIRSTIVNKNKIFKIFGDPIEKKSLLLRDGKDTKYPFKKSYADFEKDPRWKEYITSEYHPLGLVVKLNKNFAYIDSVKKEYDFTSVASLVYRKSDSREEKEKQRQFRDKVEDFWEHLPRGNQAYFIEKGLIKFDRMMAIDDKGDVWYKFPHIFVDFKARSPFWGYSEYLETYSNSYSLNGYKKVEIFPKSFSKPKLGKLHEHKDLVLEKPFLYRIRNGAADFDTLYAVDDRYKFLKVRDAVAVPDPEDSSRKNYIRITHKEAGKVKDYLALNPGKEWAIEEQIARKLNPGETIYVYEFKSTSDFLYDPERLRKLNSNS